nr:calcineurin-like phosphoesterase C-terminal domain-containing protein [Bacteroides sp. BFG-606]
MYGTGMNNGKWNGMKTESEWEKCNVIKGTILQPKQSVLDKEKVKYEWISPVLTEHLFHATPHNKNAKMEVKVTDRFGNVYTKAIENK